MVVSYKIFRNKVFGGVVKDWNGNVIRNYSELVDYLDDNKAKAFALLIGCHELVRFRCYVPSLKAILFLLSSRVL